MAEPELRLAMALLHSSSSHPSRRLAVDCIGLVGLVPEGSQCSLGGRLAGHIGLRVLVAEVEEGSEFDR
jgi:hypothetical protein